jgi:type IV fimbrial biogenesis protein FimT
MNSSTSRRPTGFTLIELMVTLAVIFTFAVIAFPSFEAVRQRAAVRSAGEQVLGFWNQARLEAAKRNQPIKVGIAQGNSGKSFCLGASTDLSTATPCDCTSATACNVARFPDDWSRWNSVTLAGVTLGGSNWPTVAAMNPVLIEPKRTSVSGVGGTVTLKAPNGRRTYLLRMNVDTLGRAVLCEPGTGSAGMSDYIGRRC